MSRHHVMLIAQPAATAFLFDDVGRKEGTSARGLRARSDRGVATATGSRDRPQSAEQPAVTRRVRRWAMKCTG